MAQPWAEKETSKKVEEVNLSMKILEEDLRTVMLDMVQTLQNQKMRVNLDIVDQLPAAVIIAEAIGKHLPTQDKWGVGTATEIAVEKEVGLGVEENHLPNLLRIESKQQYMSTIFTKR